MSDISLRKRLLLSATITLVAFLGLAGVALDRAFIDSARVSQKNQLETQILAVLAGVDIDETGEFAMTSEPPDSRFSIPNSGLYGFILNDIGEIIWRSQSSIGIRASSLSSLPAGVKTFSQVDSSIYQPFYSGFGISWEFDQNAEYLFTIYVVEESDHFIDFIQAHRKSLLFWLGMAGVVLLVVQGLIIRWGLRPLRQVMDELDLVERTSQSKILGSYPQEIAQLSERINLFIENERKNLVRYRNTLGDLAHSLKTPLAVIKGAVELDKNHEVDLNTINDHVDRMSNIVNYQLKRAASEQYTVVSKTIDVEHVLTMIIQSLQKVYHDKSITVISEIEQSPIFYGGEGDLYELLGNILDNAFKWTKTKVLIRVDGVQNKASIHPGIKIRIEDDGPGVKKGDEENVLNRGARVDQQVPGQGIGLAVTREIVERYNGKIYFETSRFNGAALNIEIPPM